MLKGRSLVAVAALMGLICTTIVAGDIELEGVKCVKNPRADAKESTGVEYRGGMVYFCCGNCAKAFSDDPEKLATPANYQLVLTKQAEQKKCPISGRDINEDQVVKVGEVEVGMCCGNCKGKVAEAEGKEQMELVFSNKAFEKAFEVKKDDDDGE